MRFACTESTRKLLNGRRACCFEIVTATTRPAAAGASVCLQAFISVVPRGCVNVRIYMLTNAADPAVASQPFRGCVSLRSASAYKGNNKRKREREKERKLLISFLYNLSGYCKIANDISFETLVNYWCAWDFSELNLIIKHHTHSNRFHQLL